MQSKLTGAAHEARHLAGGAILRGLVFVVVASLIGPGGCDIFGEVDLDSVLEMLGP